MIDLKYKYLIWRDRVKWKLRRLWNSEDTILWAMLIMVSTLMIWFLWSISSWQ